MTEPRVRRVLETVLYLDDLDAAEAFYAGLLGLRVFAKEPGRHVFFRLEGSVFLVFNPTHTSRVQTAVAGQAIPLHGVTGDGHVAFVMEPDQVDAWRVKLAAAEVPIESEVTWPSGELSIYFRDPAGNVVELATPRLWG